MKILRIFLIALLITSCSNPISIVDEVEKKVHDATYHNGEPCPYNYRE